MQKHTPAIFYAPDAIEIEGKPILGRRSSGQSFLKGFLRHIKGETLCVATHAKKHIKEFYGIAREMEEKRPIQSFTSYGKQEYQLPGSIFFPDPGYMNFNWSRMRQDPRMCSLIGITHTVSTRRIIEALHTIVAEPVEEWDAIICTSKAVHSVVARQMEEETKYYKRRFQARRVPMPQLPIIPLGINADDFTFSQAGRHEARAKFGVEGDMPVILCVGRQSSVEKAHPTPLYIALEHTARRLGIRPHLWMVGWSSMDQEDKLHREAAKTVAPSVEVQFIDGQDPWVRRNVWSGADIFTLPSDSIQETFGLVPIEAMAAGLPVIMPDWDGFRDTVIDGETGILVPTRMAPPGDGGNITERFADKRDGYLHYLAMTHQTVQIDIPAYIQAFCDLILAPDRRKTMGARVLHMSKPIWIGQRLYRNTKHYQMNLQNGARLEKRQ